MSIDLYSPNPGITEVRTGSLFRCAGTMISRMDIEAYGSMSISDFVKNIVPKLQDNPCSEDLSYFVIRDLSHRQIFTVMPDGVEFFKVNSMEEVPAEDVFAALKETLERSNYQRDSSIQRNFMNVDIPIFSYGENKYTWEVICKIPPTKILYRSESLGIPEGFLITLPKLLFKVQFLVSNNAFREAAVAVVKHDSVDPTRIVQGELPLPNIYSAHGGICMGNIFTEIENPAEATRGQLVSSVWEAFISSNWNTDLLTGTGFPSNLDSVAAEVEAVLAEEYVSSSEGRSLIRLLNVLHTPDGYTKLNWHDLGVPL